jgi:hypothetical protein
LPARHMSGTGMRWLVWVGQARGAELQAVSGEAKRRDLTWVVFSYSCDVVWFRGRRSLNISRCVCRLGCGEMICVSLPVADGDEAGCAVLLFLFEGELILATSLPHPVGGPHPLGGSVLGSRPTRSHSSFLMMGLSNSWGQAFGWRVSSWRRLKQRLGPWA